MGGREFFSGAISLDIVEKNSLKIVINLSRTFMKLHCKGETYQSYDFIWYTQTDTTNILLLL